MNDLIPAEIFPPGEYIQDELDARGWTQQDLALITGRPASAINQIVQGKRSVTPETAKGLGAAFGTSAELWLNLESAYQLAQVKTDEREVEKRAALFTAAPVNEMVRRGWIKSAPVDDIEEQLKRFFSAEILTQIPPLPFAARKSASYDVKSPAERAWAHRVLWLAKSVEAAPYNASAVEASFSVLRSLTVDPENLRKIPQVLARLGVRLVYVAHLEKTKLDGATLWLDRVSPVVAMTCRYDRIDSFMFTLFHELMHVVRGDASIDSDLLEDATGSGGAEQTDEVERIANLGARTRIVPQDKLDMFIARTRPLYSRDSILRFARLHGLHAGLVLGQLQRRQEVPWRNLRDLLTPVRDIVIGTTLSDGWGHQPGAI